MSEQVLYGSYKNVKIGCHDCKGCYACCQGMGDSVILDPYDFCCLEWGLDLSPDMLLSKQVQLNIHDGLILPNLTMAGEEERCAFLNEEGRCAVHAFRPGLCRLFPLGRSYEKDGLFYFVLNGACRAPGERTKVKISDWIGQNPLDRYEKFLVDWHDYLKSLRNEIAAGPKEEWEAAVKVRSMELIKLFYLTPYEKNKDFFSQFYRRLQGR